MNFYDFLPLLLEESLYNLVALSAAWIVNVLFYQWR